MESIREKYKRIYVKHIRVQGNSEICIPYHKSHFKAVGLYNFIRGFEWAYKRGEGGGLISGWEYKREKKCFGTTR